ncbi:conserved hypothetical protein [Neospora caninum Liverpool]|uniref:ADP-ribosylation factor-like protein 1 n=1 Tax=Neospora caninum (strain Liverpool) TaxID=572307 RepID=F0VDX3_NEOCL|nr:conserved hypothetical protein [Neospora caninum Liverpool]CBZ51916.1 conserved hypothetical protein [Neospora caninum Liverpool]CEL65878.1 TPA: ADP-ribosylation factor-like protein 1 [Neospora caninum Liverpool]|eukprot:XP_003881949.1 conserved hypothetical protein [Neospora caninum Liverpool]
MFSLVSGLYQWLFSYDELRLLLIGIDGSGKTTFLEQLKARYAKPRGRARPSASSPLHSSHVGPADAAPPSLPAVSSHNSNDVDATRKTSLSASVEPPSSVSSSSLSSSSPSSSSSLSSSPSGSSSLSCSPPSSSSSSASSPSCSVLPHVQPTTGFNLTNFVFENFKVTVWDLGGQKTLRNIWKDYYKDCHCILFFVDAADSARRDEACRAFQCMLSDLGGAAPPHAEPRESTRAPSFPEREMCSPPVLLVANKQDVATAESGERLLPFFLYQHGAPRRGERTRKERQRATSWATGAEEGTVKVVAHTALNSESVESLLRAGVAAAQAKRDLEREQERWHEQQTQMDSPLFRAGGQTAESGQSTEEPERRSERERLARSACANQTPSGDEDEQEAGRDTEARHGNGNPKRSLPTSTTSASSVPSSPASAVPGRNVHPSPLVPTVSSPSSVSSSALRAAPLSVSPQEARDDSPSRSFQNGQDERESVTDLRSGAQPGPPHSREPPVRKDTEDEAREEKQRAGSVSSEDRSGEEGSRDSSGLYDLEEAQASFELFLASRLHLACTPSSSPLPARPANGSALGTRAQRNTF